MKRILSAWLWLSALIISLSAFAGQAETGSNLSDLLGTAKVDSLAATEDSLWLLSGDRLLRWQPGQEEALPVAEQVPSAFQDPSDPQGLGDLLAYGNQLYSFNQALGTLSALALEGSPHLKDSIHYSTDLLLTGDGQPRLVKNHLMNQQGLWLLAENAIGDGFDLLLLDKAGKVRPFDTRGIRSIASYQGDRLLMIVEEEGRRPVLAQFDAKDSKTKILINALPPGVDGLCYDAGSHTAYYVSQGEVFSHPVKGKASSVAYLPAVFLYRSPALLQGHLAANLPEGVFIRRLTGARASIPTVRVYNLDEFSLKKLRTMLPDVRVTVSDRMLSAMELAQAVLSDNFPYDVAVLYIRNPQLYSLMKKGYFAPLDSFPVTANVAKRIYPVFLAPVTHQANLFALPQSIYISDYGYKQEYLDLVGMSLEELPRDILSVLHYLGRWQQAYSAFDGDVLPAFFTSKSAVKGELIRLYIRQHQLHSLPLSFDTALFRQMMAGIDRLDDQYLSSLPGNFADSWTPRVVITNLDLRDLARNRQSFSSADDPTYPLCINLEPGMPTVYPYGASYAAVMTKASNQEAAARVAAAISQADWAQNMSPVLFSDYQPLISDNYLENKLALDSYQQHLQAQLKRADGAEKTKLEQDLAELNIRLLDLEKERLVVTEEELASYRRDILPYLKPLGPALHEDSDMLMSEDLSFILLVRQMMDGHMDTEQFIQQAEQMLWLMQAEEGPS